MPGPIIETGDTLVLRTVERDDAEFVQRLFTDPWARTAYHQRGHNNQKEIKEFIEEQVEEEKNAGYIACLDGENAPWGHLEEDETTPVAFATAMHVNFDRPTINHWVPPEQRGNDYGSEALTLVIKSVFRTYDVNSIGTAVLDGDEEVREQVESTEFVREGKNREAQFVKGEFRDLHQYGLLRDEWGDE